MSTSAQHPPSHLPPDIDAKVRRVELVLSALLRIGVVVSLSVVVLGTVVSFTHHPNYLDSAKSLPGLVHPERAPAGIRAYPHSLHNLFAGLSAFHGDAIVILGLLLLIATPMMRVAVSILAFLYQKDRLFTLITAAVLTLLLLSFFLGKAGG